MYLKVFDKDLPNNLNISQRDENDFGPVENIVDHVEDFEIEENFGPFDDYILPNFNTGVGSILLELREHFNVTTKATCFIALLLCLKLLVQLENFFVVFLENHL